MYTTAGAGLQTLIWFLILFACTKIFRLRPLQVCRKKSAHFIFLLVLKLEADFECYGKFNSEILTEPESA